MRQHHEGEDLACHFLAAEVGEHKHAKRAAQQADQESRDDEPADIRGRGVDPDDEREGDDGYSLWKGDERFAQDLADDDRIARDR